MKVVGLVTEYNPFHNGHRHHLIESKKTTNSTHSIAVMSGHFLQRGEPAIMDKWTRAKTAVDNGVDLVIEIPTVFSCNSAEYFAFGAISILDQLNIVDSISFGSENGNLNEIKKISDILSDKDNNFDELIKKELSIGISYPKARENVFKTILDSDEIIELKPNNILGIEYLKSLNNLNSSIKPNTIKRIEAEYMSLDLKGSISSATSIRHSIFTKNSLHEIKNFVPNNTYSSLVDNFRTNKLINSNDLSDLLLYKIRTSTHEYLRTIHDISEGLEYRIIKSAETSKNYNELINSVVSKRFTRTRIQRIMIKILLDITSDYIGIKNSLAPKYARILAFNTKGAKLIKKIKKESDILLLTNINKANLNDEQQKMLDFDIKATNIFNLLYRPHEYKKGGSDYLITPYFLRNY